MIGPGGRPCQPSSLTTSRQAMIASFSAGDDRLCSRCGISRSVKGTWLAFLTTQVTRNRAISGDRKSLRTTFTTRSLTIDADS